MYINHDTYGEDEFKGKLKKAVDLRETENCFILCVDFYKKVDEPFRNIANIGELHTIKIINSIMSKENYEFVVTLKNDITKYIKETVNKPLTDFTIKNLMDELRNEVPGLNKLYVKIDTGRELIYDENDPRIKEQLNKKVESIEISDQFEYLFIHTK